MKRFTFTLTIIFMVIINSAAQTETATLGGGCFWCTEAIFRSLKGVESVESGYSGGHENNPSYQDVCTGETGHAEVIQLKFNPQVISYSEILEVFFQIHDPTSLNRQGADVGTQYRSVIFYHSPQQRDLAESYISQLNKENVFGKKLVTEVEPFHHFFKAEAYHQNYFSNNRTQGYCQFVIVPKMEKFKKIFRKKLK